MARKNIMERIEKLKRKGEPRISICFKVVAEVDDRIRWLAKETGLSMSRVVDLATAEMEADLKRAQKRKVAS